MTTATTKPNKLDNIAGAMRSYITATGAAWNHQRLPHGLELVLQRKVEQTGIIRWRLALGRADVQPSDDEVSICRRSFGVPEATEYTRTQKIRVAAKTGKHVILHIVEMSWIEE